MSSKVWQPYHEWVSLVYHDVQPGSDASGGGPARFSVSVNAFNCMLDTITRRGYVGCSVAEAEAAYGRRRVAITFDDGNSGQFDHALPVLLKHGMTATFYVTTDWIGRPGFMTWDQLRHLVACGMSVQSHTRSHPFLSELNEKQLVDELEGSKRILDQELGQNTTEIAFPGGDAPVPRMRHLIRESGYRIAVGSRWGINQDSFWQNPEGTFVKRCTARGEITPAIAQRVVEADRWLNVTWTAKEATLRRLRSTLGASRYSQLRRVVLDRFATSASAR